MMLFRNLLKPITILTIFSACDTSEISNLKNNELRLDSNLMLYTKIDEDSSKVRVLLSRDWNGIRIMSYTSDSSVANCLHIVQKDKDAQYVFLEDGRFRKTILLDKGTNYSEEKIHRYNTEKEEFYIVTNSQSVGRVKLWKNNYIYDLYISSDTIEYSDTCSIKVICNSRGDQIKLRLIRLADGSTLYNDYMKGPFLDFGMAYDQNFVGIQTYNAILERSYPQDPPDENGIVKWTMYDTIPIKVYWRLSE